MASTSETVVWFNAETADITEAQIVMLFKYAFEVIKCFIMIGDLRLKAVAVGKKNEMYDTSEHLYQMDLELNVIEG